MQHLFTRNFGMWLGDLVCIFLCIGWLVSTATVGTSPAQGTDMSPGNYRIENVDDGLDLTIQGVNASFATVVGDTWQNFREQKWTMKKIAFVNGYQLQPATYATNNILSFHKDPLRKYPQPETWIFKEIKGTKGRFYYQMINERTTYCLTSAGRRREVTEVKCDIYQRKQHWKITKL